MCRWIRHMLIATFVLGGAVMTTLAHPPLTVNLSHLDRLYRTVSVEGSPASTVLIYAEYPDYEPIVAQSEGMACVDDTARAVIAYTNDYRQTGNLESLAKVRTLLNFIEALQAPDGSFYNFITSEGTINRTGATSRPGFGSYAARAVWALGTGVSVFQQVDRVYASHLGQIMWRTLDAATKRSKGALVEGRADVTAYYVLGLCEYIDTMGANQDAEKARNLVRSMVDKMCDCQSGTFSRAPYGVILGSPGESSWHMWSSRQSQAIARAYRCLGGQQARWLKAVKLECESWYGSLLLNGPIDSIAGNRIKTYPQIAYSVDVMAQAYYELYLASGDAKYSKMAALAASWFLGNNAADEPMYDNETGRCYDGLDGPYRINRNSGAESTIEALLALQSIASIPREDQNFAYAIFGGDVNKDGIGQWRTLHLPDGSNWKLIRTTSPAGLTIQKTVE